MSQDSNWFSRMMLALAGILGAAGVFAAAAASHIGNQRIYGAVALIALTHAGVLTAFGLSPPKGRLLRAGAIVIAAGACIFTAALTAGQIFDTAIFSMAAPVGGTSIAAGWIVVAIAGVFGRRPGD